MYTTFYITKIFNIKRDRLQQWIDRKLIVPSVNEARGQGTKNIFSLEDLYVIQLFIDLLNEGFTRKGAAKIIKMISENPLHRATVKGEFKYVNIDMSPAIRLTIDFDEIQTRVKTVCLLLGKI